MLIGFYFLLRVGEYTTKQRSERRRTQQFRLGDVRLWQNNTLIPHDAPLEILLQAESATLKLDNQKNGIRGALVHHTAVSGERCPVKALARRVYHLNGKGAGKQEPLRTYYDHLGRGNVTEGDIVKTVRVAAAALGLRAQGFQEERLGSHSLRAGGAMALKLHGYDDTTIMKMGRWTSLTFLQYIHNQIAHLSHDISKKMSIALPFVNVAAI